MAQRDVTASGNADIKQGLGDSKEADGMEVGACYLAVVRDKSR
jgi:hypothetical protein